MEMRNLGRTGLKVSVAGLGCNNFGQRTDRAGAEKVIDAAIDVGINLFDTADFYGGLGGSETIIGEVLGARRQRIVIATKFGLPMDKSGMSQGGSRRYVMQAAEASLKRLKTDWIDVYFLHFPDLATPIDETLRALDDLVRQGKVRYIACSNLPAWQMVEAAWASEKHGAHSFVACEDEYSLLKRAIEKDVIPAATKYGMGLLPYFPLAGGLLTGKYKVDGTMPADLRFAKWAEIAPMFLTEANWRRVGALQGFADARGITMIQLAMGWLAAQPVVSSVIAGATRPEQIHANAEAVAWRPTAEDRQAIDTLLSQA